MTREAGPWGLPNFRWFFTAQAVNTAGSTMAPVALAFAVLEVSDSAAALGLVLASHSVPMVVFLLFGGVIADRLPRVPLLRVGNLVLALTQGAAALLVVAGTAELWMLVALQALNGTTLALTYPALASLMPQLVPREMLLRANVLQSMMRGVLRVGGPAAGGLLVVTVGAGWALLIDALTYLVTALLLVRVRIPARAAAAEKTSTLTELREGWSLFVGTTWLWVVVVAFSLLNAIHMGAWFTLGPVLAKDTIGEQGWGLVLSAESLGLLAMTLVMLRRQVRRPLLVGMLGVALLGPVLVLLGAAPVLVALLLAAFLAGAGLELFTLGWNLAMQENIVERMLSRAYSYDMLGSYVAIPVGQLGFSQLGEAFGIREVMVVAGIAYTAIALLTLASGAVRRLQRAPGPLEVVSA
ncbi:MFS transporter [Nocardioides sp. GCM10027113]|uniref:MFS transporter n=1 Tax=unclassified Nocardioides TaxID=2615069 RepID=UPI00362272DB